jgi:acetaldehyde dehydrogenase/alcohol dehydrogenase
MNTFLQRTEIYHGYNSMESMKNITGKKVYIVTDESMVSLGMLTKVTFMLDSLNIDWCLFKEVKPDPCLDIVKKGLQLMINFKPDTILGLGGGSVLDTAKGIIYYYMKILDTLVKNSEKHKPYFIAIPTTSGSGSEVTAYSVLTDTTKDVKIPLVDKNMIPDVAIIDSQFTMTVPPKITADTGLDVLTHAIEAYVSTGATDYTDLYGEKAIKLVFEYLPKVYKDGSNKESREKIHNASCMAGIAFNNGGLGLNHSIAHGIGAKLNIAHGRANAILLPYIIEFNSGLGEELNKEIGGKYREISRILGFPSTTIIEGITSLIIGINILKKDLNSPMTLKDAGVDKDLFESRKEAIVESVMEDFCLPTNPRQVTKEDVYNILNKISGF